MSRRWLFVRLHGPGAALPAVVGDVARLVGPADPEACFFFDRTDDHTVEVWLDARPDVRAGAEARLRAPGDGWLATADQAVTRPVRYPHRSGRDVTDELAAVSSAFGLETGAGRTPEQAFRIAVSHIRGLVELSAGDRRALAFQCWLHWSARLNPRRRVELLAEAATRAGTVPHESSAPLSAYLARTRDVVLGASLAENYLLFAQARATHDRLGLPPDASAVAALTVRDELTDGVAPVLSGRPA